MSRIYLMPSFLEGEVDVSTYDKWLNGKAQAHIRRDRIRKQLSAEASYKRAIHDAVIRSAGFDVYTGERLDWSLIGTYRNEESKVGRHRYKARFALLPTVDHVIAGAEAASFQICGWATNDAKHDLDMDAFLVLCRNVLTHAGYTVTKSG